MPYIRRTVKEIPKEWLQCPLGCGYESRNTTHFLNHFKKCEEYDGDISEIEIQSYEVNYDETVNDYIEKQMNCINTAKEFIRTNELEAIQNNTPDQIREYIQNKIILNYRNHTSILFNILLIYEFFFGETEESKKKMVDYFMTKYEITGDSGII